MLLSLLLAHFWLYMWTVFIKCILVFRSETFPLCHYSYILLVFCIHFKIRQNWHKQSIRQTLMKSPGVPGSPGRPSWPGTPANPGAPLAPSLPGRPGLPLIQNINTAQLTKTKTHDVWWSSYLQMSRSGLSWIFSFVLTGNPGVPGSPFLPGRPPPGMVEPGSPWTTINRHS